MHSQRNDLAKEVSGAHDVCAHRYCTGARRYEFFESPEQFKEFTTTSFAALQRAVPVAEKKEHSSRRRESQDLCAAELALFPKTHRQQIPRVTLRHGTQHRPA